MVYRELDRMVGLVKIKGNFSKSLVEVCARYEVFGLSEDIYLS